MDPQQIRIALPSKGHLEQETLDFLNSCGLRVSKTNPRQYSAQIPALPGVRVLFQRVRDIPKSVAAGDVDLGIAGYDTVAETVDPDDAALVTIHDALGFGECELVAAVPDEWSDVNDLAGLRTQAHRSGSLRVATKYTSLTRRFLDERGLESVQVVSAGGALEAAPAVGYADFIVDISSTGTTLRDNHLKPLADGTLLRSAAALIGNRRALETRGSVLSTTLRLLEFVEAHLQAAGQYLVFANMRGDTEKDVAARMFAQPHLGGLQGPTISRVVTREMNGGWWAVNIVVSARNLYTAIQELRAIGGSGVVATPVTYIFEESPERCQRLLSLLGKVEAAQ